MERSRYYRSQGGDDLAARFFDAAIAGLESLGEMPGAGSPRVGELTSVPGLRSWRIASFPCGWFYFERSDHADVVRLFSHAQDLESILGDVDEDWCS